MEIGKLTLIQPPTSMPNLEKEARQVAHNVLKEMNGTKGSNGSDPTTPTPDTPDAPTPTNSTSAIAYPPPLPPPAKSTNTEPPLEQRPAGPFKTNSFNKSKSASQHTSNEDDSYEDLSPRSLPAMVKAAFEVERKEIHHRDVKEGKGKRRSGKSENEPLFLKSESIGGTEYMSNSVVRGKQRDVSLERGVDGVVDGATDSLRVRRKGKEVK